MLGGGKERGVAIVTLVVDRGFVDEHGADGLNISTGSGQHQRGCSVRSFCVRVSAVHQEGSGGERVAALGGKHQRHPSDLVAEIFAGSSMQQSNHAIGALLIGGMVKGSPTVVVGVVEHGVQRFAGCFCFRNKASNQGV